jgi:hypothetical protein
VAAPTTIGPSAATGGWPVRSAGDIRDLCDRGSVVSPGREPLTAPVSAADVVTHPLALLAVGTLRAPQRIADHLHFRPVVRRGEVTRHLCQDHSRRSGRDLRPASRDAAIAAGRSDEPQLPARPHRPVPCRFSLGQDRGQCVPVNPKLLARQAIVELSVDDFAPATDSGTPSAIPSTPSLPLKLSYYFAALASR